MASSSSASSSKVDCTRAGQNVWLVKVPKYLKEVWSKADASGIVGTLRIPLSSSASKNVAFQLDENLGRMTNKLGVETPREHKMFMSDMHKTMSVFSETFPDDEEMTEESTGNEKIAFEGKITKRADCRPVENTNYMLMKRKAIEKACQPVRQVKQITSVQNSFKPVNDHAMNMEPERKRKEDGKRVRASREEVLEMLFSAFEKHQYYSLKDLIQLTETVSNLLTITQ